MKAEKRVINILKTDFDEIKEYCNKHALNMGKWLVLLAKREIEKSKFPVSFEPGIVISEELRGPQTQSLEDIND